jgi:hypothetical protein
MAGENDIDRTPYIEKIRPYQNVIDALLNDEQDARTQIERRQADPAHKRLELADATLNIASHYLVMHGIYQSMHRQKNEYILNDARKSLYRSVVYLEETVGKFIDSPLSDFDNFLSEIETVSPRERYSLVQKMGLAIQLLKQAYGDTTRWKWSFVEIDGRFATVAKNLMNMKDFAANSSPRSPYYAATIFHFRMVKKLLAQSADRYREKYEMATQHAEDFKTGINFLFALKKLNMITGDKLDTVTVQKKLETWLNKLKKDLAKKGAQLNTTG